MSDKVKQEGDKHFVEVEASAKDPHAPEDSGERVEGSFNFQVGESLAEDIEMYGEDTVREMWLRAATVKGQSAIRSELESGTHSDDVAEQLATWRPDVTHTAKKDPKTAILSNWKNLSEEEREAILADLAEQS